MILGARGALAPVWGRVSKVASKKTHFDEEKSSMLEPLFARFALTLDFSFIFEVTSDSEF